MSEIKETRVIPASDREEVVGHKCDLCGAREGCLGWSKERFEQDETTIERRYGDCYPEYSSIETTTVDICGKCFDEKLIPWLKSQGAVPRVEQYDG
jgi:hypothetical protein